MITQETAAEIYHAYREIESSNKLLNDMKAEIEQNRLNKTEAVLKDAFGRRRNLQLGVPSGDSSHRIFDVPPTLAESIIRAHIVNKESLLKTLQEKARLELSA